MAGAFKGRKWTVQEDRQLLEELRKPARSRLTYAMLSEDLGRTKESVRKRMEWLQQRGNPATVVQTPSQREINRQATKDELTIYLKCLVESKRMTLDAAVDVLEKLRPALDSDQFYHRQNWSVLQWLEAA